MKLKHGDILGELKQKRRTYRVRYIDVSYLVFRERYLILTAGKGRVAHIDQTISPVAITSFLKRDGLTDQQISGLFGGHELDKLLNSLGKLEKL